MKKAIFINKILFESFGYHFNERKRRNQLKNNTEKEYIDIIIDVVLNYEIIFHADEKNGYGKLISKLYFYKNKWVVILKYDEYDFNIITSFRLDGYKDFNDYLKRRGLLLFTGEVKDGSEYKEIITRIQFRIKPQ